MFERYTEAARRVIFFARYEVSESGGMAIETASVDLPLSNECKRILGYTAEEAERLKSGHIGTEHLLLGMLREDKSAAAQLLSRHGLKLDVVREELARAPMPQDPR